MKLLIVDDNAAVRRFIRSIVPPFVRDIGECPDGESALSVYRRQMPDVVLMDIRLKGMDGIAAARQILEADPEAKIVIVTDYDDDALRRAAKHAGACAYVLKDNLLDLIGLLDEMRQSKTG